MDVSKRMNHHVLQSYLSQNPSAAEGLAELLTDHRFAITQRLHRITLPDSPAWSPDDLHKLRVYIRHSRALWQLYSQAIETTQSNEILKTLKHWGQISSQARDLDVQLNHLNHAINTVLPTKLIPLLQTKHQQAYRMLLTTLSAEKTDITLLTWQTVLKDNNSDIPLSELAAQALAKRCNKLLTQPRKTIDDYHQLRKEFKKFRYLSEDFAPLFPKQLSMIKKAAKKMQTLLGEIQDLETQALWLYELSSGASNCFNADEQAQLDHQANQLRVTQKKCLPSIEQAFLTLKPELEAFVLPTKIHPLSN